MFIPLAGKIIGELVADKKIPENASALELGAQTYSVDKNTIVSLRKLFKEKDFLKQSKLLLSFESVVPAKHPRENVPHVREFFQALGFLKYQAIDIGDYGGNLLMDLNESLVDKYEFHETYDVVTNIGVSEHLIDQRVFMKNMHDTTKVGGYMLHILPSLGYANHGFFNYQPRFFEDLAAANGYELLELGFADRKEMVVDLLHPKTAETYFYYALSALSPFPEGHLFLVALMKKKTEGSFEVPLQGKYMVDISLKNDKDSYGVQFGKTFTPAKGYVRQRKLSGVNYYSMRVFFWIFEYTRRFIGLLLRISNVFIKR